MSPSTLGETAEWLAERPKETGLFTDFDGTLSPVVPRPEDAQPLPGVIQALHRLSRRLGAVGVVSGRPAVFLADRVGPGGVHLYGMHGFEHVLDSGEIEIAPGADEWRAAVARASAQAREAALPDVEIEDKALGLTLHWRKSANPTHTSALAGNLAEQLARQHSFQLRLGRASIELMPPIGVDKGSVVEGWAPRLARLAFIGDDVGDQMAFEVLDRLRFSGRNETLKVAVASDESPKSLLEGADVVLPGPPSVQSLILGLADRLG